MLLDHLQSLLFTVFFSSTVYFSDHTQSVAPFTAACFGPVTTMAQCMALYPTCGTGFYTINVTGGAFIDYDLDCPCFGMNGVFTYNQMTPTSG